VIATAAINHQEVGVGKCVMADQLTLIIRRIKQHGDLGFA
jgi:hypothetical protein